MNITICEVCGKAFDPAPCCKDCAEYYNAAINPNMLVKLEDLITECIIPPYKAREYDTRDMFDFELFREKIRKL